MSDLISRLSELRCQYNCFDEHERDAYHTLSEAIKAISAQRTGRKKGKWIDVNGNGNLYECDQCHDRSCCAGKYCMMCGARMEVKE